MRMEVEHAASMRLEMPVDDAMDVDAPPPDDSASPLTPRSEQRITPPPAVRLSASDTTPCAKAKLDELFVRYLATPESKSFLGTLFDDVRAGKNVADDPKYRTLPNANAHLHNAGPTNGQQAATALPGSPVSRLMRSHSPFGDNSPRSSASNTATSSPTGSETNLGRTAVNSENTTATSVTPKLSNEEPRALVLDGGAYQHAKPVESPDVNMSPPPPSSSSATRQPTEQAASQEDTVMQPAEGRTANGLDTMQLSNSQSEKRERSTPTETREANVGSSNAAPESTPHDRTRSTEARTAHQRPADDAAAHRIGRPPRTADTRMADNAPPSPRKRLPRFYFPCGPDAEERERRERMAIREFFKAQRANKRVDGASKGDIGELVVEVVGVPSYFAALVYARITKWYPADGRQRDDSQHMEQMSADSTRSNGHDATMKDSSSPAPNGEMEHGTLLGADGSGLETPPNGARGNGQVISEAQFVRYYERECAGRSKDERLFRALLEPNADRNYLIPSDFKALLRALLTCHQGLAFLHATPEFQHRYSETVIERIYFGCTRKHNGRLTLADIRRSRLLDTLIVVDEEEDINRERKYFSYEHFYVLYCRFWELDTNHDLQIDREDLMRYGGHSLTFRIVDRIFGGHARPLDGHADKPGMMSYTDFIWFCLSEEDKTSDTAIDYWFRCVDLDGDGLITMYDMEFFYQEQLHRMECFGHEPVAIRDILCQLLDMVKPHAHPPVIRRRDLRKCRLSGNFFNILFNLNKFFALEARDPLQIRQEHATPELTDWDRFAAIEYLRLSAEEEGDDDDAWDDVTENAAPLMAGEAPF